LCFKKIRPTAFELLQTLMAKIIGAFFFATFLCERAQDWRVRNYFQNLERCVTVNQPWCSSVIKSISQLIIQSGSQPSSHASISQ
jgi:hypothetical protein